MAVEVGRKTQKPPPLRRGGFYWVRDETGVVRPLVSVTEVLNEVAKQIFFVPAAIRRAHSAWSENPGMSQEEAVQTWSRNMRKRANVGSMLHSFYEAHGRGAPLKIEDLPEDDRPHYSAFLKWYDAVKPEIVQVEATVANFTYGYAGTGDLWAKVGGKLAIIDYKTGFLDEWSCAMQESAYRRGEAIIDKVTGQRISDPPEVEALYALQTTDKGTYKFVELEDRFNDFRAYMHAWHARKNEDCFATCFCQEKEQSDPAYYTVCRECAQPEGVSHLSDCSYSVFAHFKGD